MSAGQPNEVEAYQVIFALCGGAAVLAAGLVLLIPHRRV